jgi:pSer/pThr/pTyr-binding forkhead associated (FHA) protein
VLVEIRHEGQVVHALPVGTAAVKLGRSSSNDVVLKVAGVSGHHALLYREADRVLLRDLGSTNGTWLNGERITDVVEVRVGDVVQLGGELELTLADGEPEVVWHLVVERVGTPLAWPVDQARFALPDTDDAWLRVGEREVWLLVDGEERQRVEHDEPFLDGRFVLRQTAPIDATVRPEEAPLPYTLRVDLAGDRAELSHGARTVRISTANRVALLHLLGEARLREGPDGGWVDDADLVVGVWGRAHREHGANNLNVLLHRIRSTVEKAGFDRWFLERRTGQTRVRVQAVVLENT